jgi:hypothetical protein
VRLHWEGKVVRKDLMYLVAEKNGNFGRSWVPFAEENVVFFEMPELETSPFLDF